ncbi:MAG: hypothetical protein HUU06_01240 [Planctomycetaceae bacterium]|nr:hypothetical protein [Planctomycetaceae bacterium]
MDENYKFSRKFELGVLSEQIVEVLNKNFTCAKVVLPAEADMKKVENQARIEIWSPTKEMIGRITLDQDSVLNKSPFISFLKLRIAKSEKLVKNEIARIEKLRKERAKKVEDEKAAAKETAKQD